MDGASHPPASLPLGTCLFYGRKPCSLNSPLIGAQYLTISPYHRSCSLHRKCVHSHESPNLHVATVYLSHHPAPRASNLHKLFRIYDDSTNTNRNKKFKTCSHKLTNDVSTQKEGLSDLEFEILKFMESSHKPQSFPSKSELLRADRLDLVDAILEKGDWLVAGWDLESGIEEKVQKLDDTKIDMMAKAIGEKHVEASNGWVGEVTRMQQIFLGSNLNHLDMSVLATDSREGGHGPTTARNQASQSSHALTSVDRQRGWKKVADLFGLAHPSKNPEHCGKTLLLGARENQMKGANEISVLNANSHPVAQAQSIYFSDDFLDTTNLLQLPTGGQSSDIILRATKGNKKRRRKSSRDGSADATVNQAIDLINKKVNRRNDWLIKVKSSSRKKSDGLQQYEDSNIPIAFRIRGLEAELHSTLNMLQSERHALAHYDKSKQKHNIALTEFEEASDALEFRETELMNKRRELRTARAQLTASKGKLALELMEVGKSIEDKDKQLDEAMQVLKMMRTARIVWPNPALEVLLSGSFDGWTSQRRMQKSSAGVFVTALQLYPGRYEIKFIVNGEWRVDPNRPIIHADGFENNVLTIF